MIHIYTQTAYTTLLQKLISFLLCFDDVVVFTRISVCCKVLLPTSF